MKPFRQYDAIVLAGEGESSYKVCNQHKAFLKIEGQSIVNYVLKSLAQVPSVKNIFVIGQKASLLETIKQGGIDLQFPKQIILLQQKNNLYENIWHAYLSSLPEHLRNHGIEESPLADQPVLIVPCDSPLMTPHEVEYFIRHSDPERHDHVMGLTSEKDLIPFYPTADQPGIKMAYLHLKEDNVRINNLHLVKPARIGHRKYIQEMYQYRYQRNIKNVIPFAIKLFLQDKYHGYRYYLGLIFSLLFSRWNIPSLTRYFKNWVPKEGLEQWVSQGLNTRFAGLTIPFPGAALDIDNEKDYEAMKQKFQEWKSRLKQIDTQHPLPAIQELARSRISTPELSRSTG